MNLGATSAQQFQSLLSFVILIAVVVCIFLFNRKYIKLNKRLTVFAILLVIPTIPIGFRSVNLVRDYLYKQNQNKLINEANRAIEHLQLGEAYIEYESRSKNWANIVIPMKVGQSVNAKTIKPLVQPQRFDDYLEGSCNDLPDLGYQINNASGKKIYHPEWDRDKNVILEPGDYYLTKSIYLLDCDRSIIEKIDLSKIRLEKIERGDYKWI